jgi:hypothetical protein
VDAKRNFFAVAYYVGLALVLALILLQDLDDVIGTTLASHVGHNSESFIGALILAAWIQYVRPRLTGTRYEWVIAVAAGVVLLGIGLALLASDLPSRFRTINESFLALGVLVPYVQARRPLPRALSIGLPAAVLVLVLVAVEVSEIANLAETMVMVFLIPIGLDLVDRGILQSDAVTSVRSRWLWYAALIAVPVVLELIRRKAGVSGWLDDEVRYPLRGLEGFIMVLFVEVYFAVFLGWVGRSSGASHRAAPVAARR